MAVDTRLKRQSATCILRPEMLSGVYPDTSGVVQVERQAVSWMYSGILAAGAVVSARSWNKRHAWLLTNYEDL